MGRTEYCLNLKGFLCLNCLTKILGFITENLHLLTFLHFSYFLEKLVLQKKDFMMTMVKKSSHLMLYKNYILSTSNLLLETVLPANFPLKEVVVFFVLKTDINKIFGSMKDGF